MVPDKSGESSLVGENIWVEVDSEAIFECDGDIYLGPIELLFRLGGARRYDGGF